MRCNNSVAVFKLTLAASPEASGKPLSAFVDPTLPPDECGKRLGVCLILRGVPQHARPLGSRSFVDLVTISGAQDHSGKWFVSSWQV
jgi:hypothetical protein